MCFRQNRKRKSTATEQYVTESIEPQSNKPVKCGACGLILSEADWNKHKDSEHNMIAWKDGQTIVSTYPCYDLHLQEDLC